MYTSKMMVVHTFGSEWIVDLSTEEIAMQKEFLFDVLAVFIWIFIWRPFFDHYYIRIKSVC